MQNLETQDTSPTSSGWRWLMVPLWVVFMTMGLFPEQTYLGLRLWGGVVTQNALVNSPMLLYFALVGFVVVFAYQRCREHGLDIVQSRARAFSIMVYALIAFFPVRLEAFLDYASIPIPLYRHLLLATCGLKVICWLYLYSLLLRYHFLRGSDVFVGLPVLFPSAQEEVPGAAESKAPEQGEPPA